MSQKQTLLERIYSDDCCVAVIRTLGYEGCVYRELAEKLKPLVEKFGSQRVETATVHLLTYEGQMLRDTKPLAEVKLRVEVRKFAFGLLGPPPEHPLHEAFRTPEHIPQFWETEQPEEKPAKKRQKKAKAAKTVETPKAAKKPKKAKTAKK